MNVKLSVSTNPATYLVSALLRYLSPWSAASNVAFPFGPAGPKQRYDGHQHPDLSKHPFTVSWM
ncbi:hypothetical protein B0H13DRAFT_2359303 [Mycena leptocephala]|nr:hypothetical protein B0H13DRAFT_2359303 [Mycena leptocephala]